MDTTVDASLLVRASSATSTCLRRPPSRPQPRRAGPWSAAPVLLRRSRLTGRHVPVVAKAWKLVEPSSRSSIEELPERYMVRARSPRCSCISDISARSAHRQGQHRGFGLLLLGERLAVIGRGLIDCTCMAFSEAASASACFHWALSTRHIPNIRTPRNACRTPTSRKRRRQTAAFDVRCTFRVMFAPFQYFVSEKQPYHSNRVHGRQTIRESSIRAHPTYRSDSVRDRSQTHGMEPAGNGRLRSLKQRRRPYGRLRIIRQNRGLARAARRSCRCGPR